MVYRFAVDIGAWRTMLALIEGGEPKIVAYERPSTGALFAGRQPPSSALAGAVRHFLRERRVEADEIAGVGVGVPGIVDRHNGSVISCPNLRVLDGASLGAEASDELGMPVYVDNNTNLICLGEHTAGVGRGTEDMAVVSVGSGVGCGLILGGELYAGADGAACEFGHTIIVPNGLECTCGARGCLEMYCSGKALALLASEVFPGDVRGSEDRFAGAQHLIEQANAGHEKATKVLLEAFTYLGFGLTSLVNLLNPRLIVLGGTIIFAWPEGAEVARRVVMAEALAGARRNLRVEVSKLQHHAGVLGGAALVSAHEKNRSHKSER